MEPVKNAGKRFPASLAGSEEERLWVGKLL
jgi:hypothetical protein